MVLVGFAVGYAPTSRLSTSRVSLTRASARPGPRADCGCGDGTVAEVAQDVKAELATLLSSDEMTGEVVRLSGAMKASYSGILFEPKAYTDDTPRGMPRDLETYLDSADHVVVNVPPVYMFRAKCFKPSRLCAIFEVAGGADRTPTNSKAAEVTRSPTAYVPAYDATVPADDNDFNFENYIV